MFGKVKILLIVIIIPFSFCYSQIQPFGLDGQIVTSITAEHQDHYDSVFIGYAAYPYIFAATADSGIYMSSYLSDLPDWMSLGLSDKSITALGTQHWGAGPADGLTLYAARTAKYLSGDSTIMFKREIIIPIDTIWAAADSGVDRESLTNVNAIDAYYFSGHEPISPLIMGGEYGLYQGTPFNTYWTKYEFNNLQPLIMSIDITSHWYGDQQTWAVGRFGLTPAAFHSKDRGLTWNFIPLSVIEGEPASSVVINPRYPDSVYVISTGYVLLTTDRGISWENIFSTTNGTLTELAIDPFASENVFAGGKSNDNQFLFYHSHDGGKIWEKVLPPAQVVISQISSMLALDTGSVQKQGFVYIGTLGSGVWQYQYNLVTGLKNEYEIEPNFSLSQNYPNPFNPTTKIKYSIPTSPLNPSPYQGEGNRERFITLKVYDVLGNEIATLVNEEKPAGIYEVVFNSHSGFVRNLTSGVYFYQLKAGSFVQTKKMLLIK